MKITISTDSGEITDIIYVHGVGADPDTLARIVRRGLTDALHFECDGCMQWFIIGCATEHYSNLYCPGCIPGVLRNKLAC